jgi:hypothetical protein
VSSTEVASLSDSSEHTTLCAIEGLGSGGSVGGSIFTAGREVPFALMFDEDDLEGLPLFAVVRIIF